MAFDGIVRFLKSCQGMAILAVGHHSRFLELALMSVFMAIGTMCIFEICRQAHLVARLALYCNMLSLKWVAGFIMIEL